MARKKGHLAAKPDATQTAAPPPSTHAECAAKTRIGKAYGLLSDQPASVAGLDADTLKSVVISAVLADDGSTVILSHYSDQAWEMWPYVDTPNTLNNKKRLNWSDLPEGYREACKAVLYCYWKGGREGWRTPGITTLRGALQYLTVICRYFVLLGLRSFSEVQPLHVANFVHAENSRGLSKSGLRNQFAVFELLHTFRDEHPDIPRFHPWPDSSAAEMAGFVGHGFREERAKGRTPLIPVEISQTLFFHADGILKTADAILDERDAGLRSAYRDPEVRLIRAACFYLIGVLTGARQSEITGIEIGAAWIEVKNGITFHWLKTVEHKTKKGRVDYLMSSMLHEVLRVMERWSEPYRQELEVSIVKWERVADKSPAALKKLASARASRKRLFLAKHADITTISQVICLSIMKEFARDAGVDWDLAPHQMRRLYAYTFVRHRLGNLLFLKEQFKHSSIDMSQLYAANPHQDVALYDEILEELTLQKAEVIAHWLDKDEPLAGGAGLKIIELRAHDFPGRPELILETSNRLNIRSTGHSWCLAQDEGCGGSGIYEKGRCGGCHNGLIDRTFKPVWEEAYRHHRELLADAESLGPGAVKRVTDDLAQATRILKDLGASIHEEKPDGQSPAR